VKVALSTYGTLGEVLPHIALGQRLQQRGHEVRLALPPSLTARTRPAEVRLVC
jgi:UDP:flavonoid glycosyltransferase YjiC (YdhE family)